MTPPGFVHLTDSDGPVLVRASEITLVARRAPPDRPGSCLALRGEEDWIKVAETVEQVASLMCSAAKPGAGS